MRIDPYRLHLTVADEEQREQIYRLRHEVYACELGQHPFNPSGRLTDALDQKNVYIVAKQDDKIAGFVSVTPPEAGRFSIEKYVSRSVLPFPLDDTVYELRLLTVAQDFRGGKLAPLLMYAALRWVQTRNGVRVVGMGRRELLSLYRAVGFQTLGRSIQSGAVTFELMIGDVLAMRRRLTPAFVSRLEARVEWLLDEPEATPQPDHTQRACFHGGAFFRAIGPGFENLARRHNVINADVLDAWFPPAPGVIAAMEECLPWLIRTSPPTQAEGLQHAIAKARDTPVSAVLVGAGSSSLIYLALRHWLTSHSRVLLLDPAYGEYSHLLEEVIGCQVDYLTLRRERDYQLDPIELESSLKQGFDLVVLVNPNNPTGQHLPAKRLAALIAETPAQTRFWIDETYVDYVGMDQSLESLASRSQNVVVCKSMSKAYALSGLRVGYLCGPPALMADLRSLTPPWAVGLPAQLAAVRALENPEYYRACYEQTHRLREQLERGLNRLPGVRVIPGTANFILFHVADSGPGAEAIVQGCESRGLFLRNAGRTSRVLTDRSIRIAVKDAGANEHALSTLREVLTLPVSH